MNLRITRLSTEAICSVIGVLTCYLCNTLFAFVSRSLLANDNVPVLIFSLVVFSGLTVFVVTVSSFALMKWRKVETDRVDELIAVIWRAGVLGCAFASGLTILAVDKIELQPFGRYFCLLAFFHYSEYLAVALSSQQPPSLDSFLLNHSVEYWIAAVGSWLEFFVEFYLFNSSKSFVFISQFGTLICVIGEILRKCAMLTAGSSFTHLIQYRKSARHRLVTTGIYSLFRHPSYVGWFWWSVGTQITLCNPVCTVLYALISWRFFKQRIFDEEITLINFYGEDYVEYQKRVPTGLPGIVGFRP